MSVQRVGRRMFLRTLGGGLLAAPWLPSLLDPRQARAAEASEAPRCFVSFKTGHGGALPKDYYPSLDTLTQSAPIHDWRGRWGTLAYTRSQGRAKISNILEADADKLTPALAAKFNLLMGIDYAQRRVGHNNAAHLGAYAQGNHDPKTILDYKPTLDHLIARSGATYRGTPSHRVVSIQSRAGSWYHTAPGDKNSRIVRQPTYETPSHLWFALFQPSGNSALDSDRVYAVDRALESYRRLSKGASTEARRLSAADRAQLDGHMESLLGLQRQIERASACGERPEHSNHRTGSGIRVKEWELYAQIIQSAVLCGISRVFTIGTDGGERYTSAGNNFHHDVAHLSALASPDGESGPAERARRDHRSWYQKVFELSVLPIVRALDVEDAQGRNILDASAVLWTSECGSLTHHSVGVPLALAGGLGGRLHTNRFIDYRDPSDTLEYSQRDDPQLVPFWQRGLPYDQLLGTLLQGFDVPLEEYDHYRSRESTPKFGGPLRGEVQIGGYGGYARGLAPDTGGDSWLHAEAVRAAADDPLPMLWKG